MSTYRKKTPFSYSGNVFNKTALPKMTDETDPPSKPLYEALLELVHHTNQIRFLLRR